MGTYEAELHQIVNNIIKKKYQRIIDIGSAEGYYAVGIPFAMKDESMEVVAVEISEVAKKNLKRLIKNNIKNKVQITDNFDFQKYQDDKKTLVIMDCEGSEMDYLKIKKYIAENNIINVFIKRKINNLELSNIYDSHDIFCLASNTRAEAFGIVLIEALSFGLPILVGKNEGSGMLSICENNYNGFSFNYETDDFKKKLD
ncbi:glycosyltransferase, partial [Candidatus Pelagibacter sp.]|nr:glycosyltransferase [Candidatus Pelagibacter sp.]